MNARVRETAHAFGLSCQVSGMLRECSGGILTAASSFIGLPHKKIRFLWSYIAQLCMYNIRTPTIDLFVCIPSRPRPKFVDSKSPIPISGISKVRDQSSRI